MTGFRYTLLAAISFLAFGSCSNRPFQDSAEQQNTPKEVSTSVPASSYGSYLAGRIAHYRQDFDSAAEYYMKTAQKDPNNAALLNRTFLMLASQGRIAEAAQYAETAKAKGDTNDFIAVIIAADKVKQQNYDEAIKIIKTNTSPLYSRLITPFVKAWAYTGQNQYSKAIASLDVIKGEKGLEAMYHFHAGMIRDYFDKPDLARKHFDAIVNDTKMDMSVRTLEVVCNFYLRNGEKDKAVALSAKYANTTPPVEILQRINQNVINTPVETASPLIISPQAGLSEALFNIAAIIKNNSEILDFSHIFIRLAIYENPHNDLARILLGNILEIREMYADAIAVYDEIPETSNAYYIAQYKKASDLRSLNDYKASELLLKGLAIDYPNDYQLLLDLGDTLRLQDKYQEALKYYNKVLKQNPRLAGSMWQIYYALGITYERMGDWNKAEQNLQKALQINPDNLLVQNYLGYSWLKQGRNTEQAFSYIVSAYNQASFNSSIIDSLGWAFYRLGMYNQAISYLEKAVDNDPSNALINEHLGDAYWMGGRKNEARFQWNHALTLKDDSGEVKPEEIKQKLANGIDTYAPLAFDQAQIEQSIAEINNEGATSEK